ncbi:hypothetical protein EIN_083000 [Entamoeba invadens IP1]|uniref:hypothetical protein n=1 Tax=Entamoeba invadens IP1 TaxID=370355 RepID=UPI0002C3EF57|nr:hypothetical protein EIN_083000 [Entamoeba invadens IP1]ELP85188.1 hypothetical protein EIN_083000 [Entamoeba invadens IP1]|eukprot:XP_004184534.1 hypothetical protein EIN_083000 [Entamoeba invadens IP1]
MSQLPALYLMKVSLHLNTKDVVKNFIQVNKKCKETVENLKVTPYFINDVSIIWFVAHFSPETVECRNTSGLPLSLLSRVSCIRHPDFTELLKRNELNDTNYTEVFNKVTRLVLYNEEDDDLFSRNVTIMIQHAKDFSKLEYIEGPIDIVTEFMEQFTEYGKEKYNKMPKRILLLWKRGEALIWTEEVCGYITRIENCVPNNGEVKVFSLFKQHTPNEESLAIFKITQYCYVFLGNQSCNTFIEKITPQRGIVSIKSSSGTRSINKVIENCYSKEVRWSVTNDDKDESAYWEIPKCVESLCISPTSLFYQAKMFQVNMEHLKYLTLRLCRGVTFSSEMKCLKQIVMDRCMNVTIKECSMKSVEEVFLDSCNCVSVERTLTNVTRMILNGCETIKMETKMKSIHYISLKSCTLVELPHLVLNRTTHVILDSYKDITFFEQSPFDQHILEESKTSNRTLLVFPQQQIEKGEVFNMRPFIPCSLGIGIEKDQIVKFENMKSQLYEVLLSNYFYNQETMKDPILKQINQTSILRYFEVEVVGHSWVSIGCVDSLRYNKTNAMLGWFQSSIGYHSDDGHIFYESGQPCNAIAKPYGNVVGEVDVVGCGYDVKKQRVFFTLNGNLIAGFRVYWKNISAGIAVADVGKITVNYGAKPFVYNTTEHKL